MATTDDGTAPPTTEDVITNDLLEEEECDSESLKLAKLVEEQKFLYEDTNNNKSIKKRKEAWRVIGAAFNVSGETVQLRFKNMRTTLGRKLPKISSLNQLKGISKHLKYLVPHMRDKHGELMFKQDIHKRDSVQTGSTKMSEKPESSMLPMMVDDQCSGGRPTIIIIIMHTHVS